MKEMMTPCAKGGQRVMRAAFKLQMWMEVEACGMSLMKDSRTVAHRARAKELLVIDMGDYKWSGLGRRMGLFIC